MAEYDAIVVGSGFGATVAVSHLAERGMKVLMLERGTWWQTPAHLGVPPTGGPPPLPEWARKSGSALPRPILAAARSRGGTYRSPRLDPAPAQPRWPVRVLPLRRVRHRFRERSRRGLADLLQRPRSSRIQRCSGRSDSTSRMPTTRPRSSGRPTGAAC